MADKIVEAIRGPVAVLTLDDPPTNALTPGLRAGLIEAIGRAEANSTVRVVLLLAAPPGYPAGADLAEFDAPQPPDLAELCSRIEVCRKPVVAGIQGAALGGGLDLALACHYRLAEPTSRLGFPEIGLGVVPQGGGTQRLPRLVGAAAALDMLLGGVPVTGESALALRLVDALGPSGAGFASFAEDYAAKLAATGARPRPTRDRRDGLADGRAYLAAVATRRKAMRDEPVLAATRLVDCVEATALMSFDVGLEVERAAFDDCRNTPESLALRHAVQAERRAARSLAAATSRRAPPPPRVGIAGDGAETALLAFDCLAAGLDVTLVASGMAALETSVARVDRLCDGAIARGTLTEAERDARLDRLSGAVELAALSDETLVLVAAAHDADETTRNALMADLGRETGAETVLAVATRWADTAALAEASGAAERVLALVPAGSGLRLVEIGATPRTGAAAVATAAGLARRMGRMAIGCAAAPGLVVGRVRAALHRATDRLLEEGATPAGIDVALQRYGFPLGPYRMRDAEGLDPEVARLRRKAASAQVDPPPALEDYLTELGWLGRAAGRGWYRYADGLGEKADDPDVLAVIADERRVMGIEPRQIADDEIVARCLDAMANEGARLVRTRQVRVPSDIDVAMLHGAMFPRWRGGPMLAADLGGIPALERRLRRWSAGRDAGFWAPDPLIVDLRKNGRDFATLNGA